jgi:serine/threonine protein kinase
MPPILNEEKIGSYKIIEKIGEGGMAIIYKAIQPSLNRTVVIKKLKDPNREIIERFKKEAYVSASFSQENVLTIYDFILYNKSYYLVMEYVNGKNLRTIIDHISPLPPNIAALIAREIARGLEYTHSRSITHRDIKPGNILLSYGGDIKIIDFGVAKDEKPSKLTMTGMIVGTPSYMSPEQANGDKITNQSDIYSLGVLLYEMVTGIKPFSGDTNTELLLKIIKGKYPSPKKFNQDLSWRLVRIIKKCMHRKMEKRYKNAAELIHDLDIYIPWQGHAYKAKILSEFLRKFDSMDEITMSDSTDQPFIFKRLSLKFWFNTFIFLLLFIFTIHKLNDFFKNERLSELSIRSNIENCKIYINNNYLGKMTGKQSTFNNIPSGYHLLKITDSQENGAFFSNILSTPRKSLSIDAIIPESDANARLSIDSQPPKAIIFLNGHNYGLSPIPNSIIKSGKYKISLVKEGYHTYNTDIQIRNGQNYTFDIILQKK